MKIKRDSKGRFVKGHKVSNKIIKKRCKTRRENRWNKNPKETKRKMRENHKGMLDKKQSKETKSKIRENAKTNPNFGMKGKYHSEETKRKMKDNKLKNPIKYWLGKTHSEEHKRKGSISKKEYFKEHPEAKLRMKNQRAKQIFPIKDTSIEVKIRNFLDRLKIEYFQHKYINIKHSYQCDFFIPYLNLVIETDGDYWHKYPVGRDIDHIRTSELLSRGFKVLRLWECEIKDMDINQFRGRLRK